MIKGRITDPWSGMSILSENAKSNQEFPLTPSLSISLPLSLSPSLSLSLSPSMVKTFPKSNKVPWTSFPLFFICQKKTRCRPLVTGSNFILVPREPSTFTLRSFEKNSKMRERERERREREREIEIEREREREKGGGEEGSVWWTDTYLTIQGGLILKGVTHFLGCKYLNHWGGWRDQILSGHRFTYAC